jgi:hypothetical protein
MERETAFPLRRTCALRYFSCKQVIELRWRTGDYAEKLIDHPKYTPSSEPVAAPTPSMPFGGPMLDSRRRLSAPTACSHLVTIGRGVRPCSGNAPRRATAYDPITFTYGVVCRQGQSTLPPPRH